MKARESLVKPLIDLESNRIFEKFEKRCRKIVEIVATFSVSEVNA